MRAAEQYALSRRDCVPHPIVHAAVRHNFALATISPNVGITPPRAHFSGATRRSQVFLQQSSFHQLLQIVTASRSGCVRLTYRIPGQVWHKGGVCQSSVQRSDQVGAASTATGWQQWTSGAVLLPVPPQRNEEIEKAPRDRNSVCNRGPSRGSFRIVRASRSTPYNLGIGYRDELGLLLN